MHATGQEKRSIAATGAQRAPLTVAAACVPDVKGDLDANLRAACELTRRLASLGARLVLLPESCLQGYAAADASLDRGRIRDLAEPADGRYASALRAVAREAGVYLVAAYDRRDGEHVYNSAELIGPDGRTIGVHDKLHVGSPPDRGLYAAGRSLQLFQTDVARIGILICVDRTVHENWRVLMLQGAELVLVPANGGYGDDNTQRLVTMARDNAVCCAFAHPRRAIVVSHHGRIVDIDRDPLCPWAIGALELGGIAARQADVRARRRPELYGPIVGASG